MTSVVVTQTTINASVVQESVSVSVTSSPINVTISPVDINSHSAVTIGTANGLSLSGQVLSLGLSSALATGALSNTDWSTFNNKQAALTFPLAASLGGTGIANGASATLTLPNLAITLGGGGAAQTYTLPAAGGTFALLNAANVFTSQNSMRGALNIWRSANAFGAGTYSALVLGDTVSGETLGTLMSIARNNAANVPFTAFTGLDSGTKRILYFGGTGWGVPDATEISFYTATTYNETINAGVHRLKIESTGNVTIGTAYATTATAKVDIDAANCALTFAPNGWGASLKISHSFPALYLYATTPNKGVILASNNDGSLWVDQVIAGVSQIPMVITAAGFTGFGLTAAAAKVHIRDTSATTNAVVEGLRIESESTGTPAAGFGISLNLYAETATVSTRQLQGRIATSWIDSANASRKAKMSLSAYDTAERVGLTIDANGTVPVITTFGQTMVDGGSDVIQLRVQAHSTQTSALQTWETSAGVVGALFDGAGRLFVGAKATAGIGDTSTLLYTDAFITAIDKTYQGVSASVTADPSGNTTQSYRGGLFTATSRSTNTRDFTSAAGGLLGGTFSVSHLGSGTLTAAKAATFMMSGKTITTMYGSITEAAVTSGFVWTNLYHAYLANATGAGTLTNQYGLYVEAMTKGGTLNYAIYTNAGLVRFGDIVNTTESYQVDGTQVVTNRVIDARIDDVINSGDATTDGVIDAIRDALITHGLIAAA